MSDSSRRPRFRILSDEVVRREGVDSDITNPYWDFEEWPPHPDPSKGCVRRGYCCRSSPGWFAPGEVEEAAVHRGMSPDDFVRRYLVIDHIVVDGSRVDVFAPAKIGRDGAPIIPPATRTDALYQGFPGTCIFYEDEQGCGIYPVRPYECRAYDCTHAAEDNPRHEDIARMWRDGRE